MIPRGATYWTLRQAIWAMLSVWIVSLRFSYPQSLVEAIWKLFGTRDFVMYSRARVALREVLRASGALPGDKIVMPPISIRPMLDVVVSLGLEPVFCDLNPKSLVPNSQQLDALLDEKVRFVLITPLFGVSADCSKILEVVGARNIVSIIDVSQCTHTKFKETPLWSGFDYAIASFSALKTIDSLGGGLLFSPKGNQLQDIRARESFFPRPSRRRLGLFALRNFGFTVFGQTNTGRWIGSLLPKIDRVFPGAFLRFTGSRSASIRQIREPGFSERFSNFQSRLVVRQIDKAGEAVDRRKSIATRLRKALRALPTGQFALIETDSEVESDFWQLALFVDDPQSFQRNLWLRGVDTGATSLSFLPDSIRGKQPLEHQLVNARRVHASTIFLPVSPKLSNRDISLLETIISRLV